MNQLEIEKYATVWSKVVKYDFFNFVYYILFYLLSGQNTETIVQIILLGVTKTQKRKIFGITLCYPDFRGSSN